MTAARTPGVRPFGEAAVLLEVEANGLLDGARRARAMAARIEGLRVREPALGVPVAAATSVLVPFDPDLADADGVAALLAEIPAPAAASPGGQAVVHRIPVRYGGDDGPDLERVAEETGLSVERVVELHAAADLEVLFLGFAPGFAYLGELPRELAVPRLASPRVRVPAGSVAIAGRMSAIYPHPSPGGWRILGRTDEPLFDPDATPPSRLRPGDRVRFEPA